MAGSANCWPVCSRRARWRRSTSRRWPPLRPTCCARRRHRHRTSVSACRPCSTPPWTCMPNWRTDHHAPLPRAFAWTPAWALACVALWPLPGPAEGVLALGALAVLALLAVALVRGQVLPLPGRAAALASVLFAAYWLPQLLSAPDALDRARAWKEVAVDLRYLPFLWAVAIAAADARGLQRIGTGLALIVAVWSVDALLQAASGTSALFWSLDSLQRVDR